MIQRVDPIVNPAYAPARAPIKLGDDVMRFHRSLPGYTPTRLVASSELADELGVQRVLIKEESERLGLPSFKMLGASYAVSRALSAVIGSMDAALPLGELRTRLKAKSAPTLYAATDGNHGRAVARVASMLGVEARIYFPHSLSAEAKAAIANEGAEAIELNIPYDDVVARAAADSERSDGLLIQDTSWDGYTEIPQWIVEGYSTMFQEINAQLGSDNEITSVVVPVGVGSLAQAVALNFAGSSTRVLTVEADSAPVLAASLAAGEPLQIPTGETVMSGLNCGTLSITAWPLLRRQVYSAAVVDDAAALNASARLRSLGIDSGPCGAATLAAARTFADSGMLEPHESVLLLSTEGHAANPRAWVDAQGAL